MHPRYGVHAKEVLPRLKNLDMMRKRWGPQVKAIEAATESPTLVSLQEFIDMASAGGEVSPGTKKEGA